MAAAGGDSPGMDLGRGLGPGRRDGEGADLRPGGGGELGPGGVVGADEHHPIRPAAQAGGDGHQGWPDERRDGGVVEAELDVAATAVALGADFADQACVLEDLEMEGEVVARQVHQRAELAGGGVAEGQVLHDGEPDRFAEGRETRRPHPELVGLVVLVADGLIGVRGERSTAVHRHLASRGVASSMVAA